MNIEKLNEEFYYSDGKLLRKVKRGGFDIGTESGSINSTGYKLSRFLGKKYLTHRLIFALVNGYMPRYIDHIDGDPLNNSIENLRECTFSENRCNVSRYKNNTTGVKGVSFHKGVGKYAARVQVNGSRKSVGYFDTIDEAAKAISKARNEMHGEFAKNT